MNLLRRYNQRLSQNLTRCSRAIMLLAAALTGLAARAQTFNLLTNFSDTAGTNYGRNPQYGSLVQASDGNFYGTTQIGGTSSKGVVFRVTPTGAYTLVHTFTSSVASTTDGGNPYSTLIQGTDGNLYGMTYAGGSAGLGTIYQIALPSLAFSLLHSFVAGSGDGSRPFGNLVQGTDGNFYGTTSSGGTSSGTAYGTVFKMNSTGGNFTVIHSFAGSDGNSPRGTLLQGTDGYFYGTTNSGGTNSYGSIFKLLADGTSFQTLFPFTNATGTTASGYSPISGLTAGPDGNFYGVTTNGGVTVSGFSFYGGTAFRITPGGTFTSLHAFDPASEGGLTDSPLVLASDGKFYGLLQSGNTNNLGSIYQLALDGTSRILRTFSGSSTDAAYARGGFVQSSDGTLYGTTYYGGAPSGSAAGYGTVFQYQPLATALTGPVALTLPASVVSGRTFTLGFAVSNAYSQSLQQCFATNTAGDTTGWVGVKAAFPTTASATLTAPSTVGTYTYTLTCGGVESGFATLNVTAPPTPVVTSISTSGGPAAGGTNVSISGTGFTGATAVRFGSTAASFTFNSDTSLTAVSPAGTGTVDITVVTAGGTSATSSTDRFTYQATPTTAQTITFPQSATPATVGTSATLAASSTSGLPVTFSIVSGLATLSGTNNATITYTGAGQVVIAADQAGNGTYLPAPQVTRAVTAAAPTFAVTGFPSIARIGTAYNVTVTAKDVSGNTLVGFTGAVTLSSTDAVATLPASYMYAVADNGTHTFLLTLNTSGTQTITATSGATTGTQTGIYVDNHLFFTRYLNSTSFGRLSEDGTLNFSATSTTNSAALRRIAFDNIGNPFSIPDSGAAINKLSPATGTVVTTYTGGGLTGVRYIAIDGQSTIFTANQGTMSSFDASGNALSPSTGYFSATTGRPQLFNTSAGVAVDISGAVWIGDNSNSRLIKVFGAGSPTVGPLAAGLTNNTLATRP